jgi:hypothetical protein
MHHSQSDIMQRLTGKGLTARAVRQSTDVAHVVTLARGDTAWNPSSTSRQICGPAIVRYTRYPDGGVDARVDSTVGDPREEP